MNAMMPRAPKLKKILGPSFVLLGLGLGSGELILWPYLTAHWGLGILWGALLGISFQFFLNMEIERWALVKGESVFVGLTRKFGSAVAGWFIFSTLIPWMWPGIIMSSAVLMSEIFGGNTAILTIIMLFSIGALLTLGPVIYKTEEAIQKWLIILGVPIITAVALGLSRGADWGALFLGLAGRGEGYSWLPKSIPFLSFLAAFAYSGAGGNLNLAQSFYIKEKGYGMGKYGSKMNSILTGKKEEIKLEGKTFALNATNLKRFEKWWKVINLEHGLVFWLTGFLTIAMLALLSYVTVHGSGIEEEGIGFLLEEAKVIGIRTLPIVGSLFLLIAGLMLFSTQLSVMDASSRIMSENLVLWDREKFKLKNLAKFYYVFLWVEILLSVAIVLLGLNQPLILVMAGAGLNAVAMLVYLILMLWLNLSELPKELRPKWGRVTIMLLEIGFFSVFCFLTLRDLIG
ncbi:Nramp family divalent metal transporter [Patescibacteria group bacterium]|nr:Nramp family divalent metal transporter [Patescibacteria group bacterium]